jgi:hypothetical protein
MTEPAQGGLVPRAGELVLAAALAGIVALVVAFEYEEARRWTLIPIAACGTIALLDALDAIRGRRDPFDPIALVGLVGVHAFFLAPLLHGPWDMWLGDYEAPYLPDWRDWLGTMAALNALGLVIYRIASRTGARADLSRPWRVNRERLIPLLLIAVVVSAVVEVTVFATLGGVREQVETMVAEGDASVAGMGWEFVVGEAFPTLAFLGFLVLWGKSPRGRSWPVLVTVLVSFLALKLFFGGFRGARANTVFALAWALGAVHIWVRPLPRTLFVAAAGVLLVFSFFYGFFKDGGFEGLDAAMNQETREDWEAKTKRGPEAMVLGDLSRSDVHAYALAHTTELLGDYQLGLGRSYVGDIAGFIPRSLWPGRPVGKAVEGTEITLGAGTFEGVETFYCRRQWGLVGEFMLNFGPVALPLPFLFLGVVVRRVSCLLRDLAPDDPRRLLLPLASVGCPLALYYDLDNMLLFVLQHGGFLIAVLALSIERGAPLRPSSVAGDM